ncbi:MAG: UDP-glucose 4-epimerase, partial [Candidatus Firestonebacteria bacterium]
INIGTGRATDVNELYRHIAKATGFKTKPLYGPARAGDIRKSILSAAEAKKVLKWTPKVELEEGIEETVAYFKNRNG